MSSCTSGDRRACIGLGHKIHAYSLQDEGRDTVQANEDLGLPVDSRRAGSERRSSGTWREDPSADDQQPGQVPRAQGFGLTVVNRVPCCSDHPR